MANECPTIHLKDGTKLSFPRTNNLPALKIFGIPEGFQDIAVAYLRLGTSTRIFFRPRRFRLVSYRGD